MPKEVEYGAEPSYYILKELLSKGLSAIISGEENYSLGHSSGSPFILSQLGKREKLLETYFWEENGHGRFIVLTKKEGGLELAHKLMGFMHECFPHLPSLGILQIEYLPKNIEEVIRKYEN